MKTVLHKCKLSDIPDYAGPVLLPVDSDLEDIPYGQVMVELKKSRNPGNHRRFFAFVKNSFDMQDEFDSIEVWRKYITMKAGFFDEVVTEKGVMYWPQSIAWEKMDEIEFRDMFNKVINAFIRYYGKNLDQSQINAILEF